MLRQGISILTMLGLVFTSETQHTPVRALSNTIFVNASASGANTGTSWVDAYTNLQTALAAASYRDEVWVAAGTYTPTSDGTTTISFNMRSGVKIYGGFASGAASLSERDWTLNQTILSGNIGDQAVMTDNSDHVVYAGATITESALLDGFHIISGNAATRGGGIYTVNGSDVHLANLTVMGNQSGGHGGGAQFYGKTTLTNTAFISNNTGIAGFDGGGAAFNGPVYATDVVFSGNSATRHGGGAVFWLATSVFSATFSENTSTAYGGGALFAASAIVNGATFNSNQASDIGGGATFLDTTIISNTIFRKNQSTSNGGGLYSDTTINITGASFIDNRASKGGGLFINKLAQPGSIVNSIFARNSAADAADAMYLLAPDATGGNVNIIFTTIASPTLSSGTAIVIGNGTANITNTIIASHTVAILQTGAASANENYNLFAGNVITAQGSFVSGGNSIEDSIQFIDASADNYFPAAFSPSIDAGVNVGIDTDFHSHTRPFDSGYDIGAYEQFNRPPVADAGAEQSVLINTQVTLNGASSFDLDDPALTFGWSQISGAAVALSSASAISPTFTTPSSATVLVFQLIVTDSLAMVSSPSVVTITVQNNNAPTAVASAPSSALLNTVVTLSGDTSTDPDGQAIIFGWSQISGTTVTLANRSATTTTFTAPGNIGQLMFQLVVTDSMGLASTPSRVTVTVTETNTAPIANAGAPQSIEVGKQVTLTGAASSDPEGHSMRYRWSQTSGTAVSLSNQNAVQPTFTAPGTPATLVFRLVVTDSLGLASTPSAVTITVLPSHDAWLRMLTLSAGTLTPAFVSTTTIYTSQVSSVIASVLLTATPSYAGASYALTASPNAPNGSSVPLSVGANTITVTVTAQNGTTVKRYVIQVQRKRPVSWSLLTPNTGPPAGGMPVSLFGTSLSEVTSVMVESTAVTFTKVGDTRLNFIMPAGTDKLMADVTLSTPHASVQIRDVFTYITPQTTTLQAPIGGVITTTTRSVTITVPPQNTIGTMSVTYAPVPPPVPTALDKLLLACRIIAGYNNVSVQQVVVSLYLQVKTNPGSLSDEYRIALFRYVEGGSARGQSTPGNWVLMRDGEYNPVTGEFSVSIKDMGIYAIGTIRLHDYWFPMTPTGR